MPTAIRCGRFYFWPLITANTTAMTRVVGGNMASALELSIVICALASFGFLLNDLWDRVVDRVNNSGHFERSDPKTILIGKCLAACLLTLGLGLAASIGLFAFAIA